MIETHSEHLIRRLQSLVADPEHQIKKDDVQVFFFQPGADGTDVRRMPLNAEGMFEGEWPEGFFDEAVNLSIQHLEAISKRGAP